jgi:hypothetical protein
MNSDEDKLYMKMVTFNEIYNFVVKIFLSQIINILSISQSLVSRFGYYIDYLSLKIASNEKSLNYKTCRYSRNYKFHIKFTSI